MNEFVLANQTVNADNLSNQRNLKHFLRSAEVFGIDIVHAVEFSRIGRSWLFTRRQPFQGNFSIIHT